MLHQINEADLKYILFYFEKYKKYKLPKFMDIKIFKGKFNNNTIFGFINSFYLLFKTVLFILILLPLLYIIFSPVIILLWFFILLLVYRGESNEYPMKFIKVNLSEYWKHNKQVVQYFILACVLNIFLKKYFMQDNKHIVDVDDDDTDNDSGVVKT